MQLPIMRCLFFKSTSDQLFLCVFSSLLWVVTNSNKTELSMTNTAESKTVKENNPLLIKTIQAPPPPDVQRVDVVTQDESTITLQWNKVDGISTYRLMIGDGEPTDVPNTSGEPVVHVVSGLTAGRRYSFTLFTVFNGLSSSGYQFTAVTAPPDTERFEPIRQNETSITLQWTKVGEINNYTLLYNGEKVNITHSEGGGTYTVSGLTSATRYSFSLFTVFDYAPSTGKNITAVTAPPDTERFEPIRQNETSITLQWTKVGEINNYTLLYNEETVNITHSEGGGKYTVSGLTSGTRYSFTLLTVFDYAPSRGETITAVTVVPPDIVMERLVNRATLQWENPNEGWKYHLNVDEPDVEITPNNLENIVSYSVTNLKPGTKYAFRVIAIFSGLNSTIYSGFIVTTIDCGSVTWHVTNSSIQGTVEGLFSKATASYESNTHVSPVGTTVSFTDLRPGATYEISLEYELSSTLLPQCSIKVPIIPPSLTASCSYWGSGYGAVISWDTPDGVWTAVEVIMNGQAVLVDGKENKVTVNGLQPARRYEVSLTSKLETEYGNKRSEPSVSFCSTDNRGVIAGSVLGVLLFCVLIGVIALIVLKRREIIRRKMTFISALKTTDTKEKTVSLARFPNHFHQMSLDENRGFSQEYEGLAPVGTDQTYDRYRVKLNTSTPNESSDYVNASYIPGYNSNREYIATQGPLRSTVNDFWRMVWEQKVRRIVMVTNHIEAGRTKCEQYWSKDMKQRLYGEVLVTGASELKELNWTLREFRLKHKNSSEERTVKHFHFTVWPDRGVPLSTEVLIRFRGVMRQHIESEGSEAPTVVHCSDGVGRTGTFIALDVLLQQLKKEQAVGIKQYLHKMRRHRSHMVQTESQYVFLHQCIMDSLQPHVTQEEHIYENDDLIYENAIVLPELP